MADGEVVNLGQEGLVNNLESLTKGSRLLVSGMKQPREEACCKGEGSNMQHTCIDDHMDADELTPDMPALLCGETIAKKHVG